jgi:hypothetical protein
VSTPPRVEKGNVRNAARLEPGSVRTYLATFAPFFA